MSLCIPNTRSQNGDPASNHLLRAIARFESVAMKSRQKMTELNEYRRELLNKVHKHENESNDFKSKKEVLLKKLFEQIQDLSGLEGVISEKDSQMKKLEEKIKELCEHREKLAETIYSSRLEFEVLEIEKETTQAELEVVDHEIEVKQDNLNVTKASLENVEEQLIHHDKLVKDAKEKSAAYRKRNTLLNNPKSNYLLELEDPMSRYRHTTERQRQSHYQFLDELEEEDGGQGEARYIQAGIHGLANTASAV